MLKLAALLVIALTAPVLAQETSVPPPHDRPAATETEATPPLVPLPRDRPSPAAPTPAPATPAEPVAATPPAADASAPPAADGVGTGPQTTPTKIVAEPVAPPRDYQVACPSVMEGKVTAKSLPPIHEGQCGLQSPLSVEAVSANGRSIPFNAPVITDCGMATAVPPWIEEVDSYVFAHDKTRIKTINIGTGYQCRNVNHAKSGNLSFHGFADALDLMGFTLEDGRTISIAPGFRGTPEQGSQILHFARDSACTHFMTVLGPDADAEHQDNMHVDLACHGKNCVTRMCQ